MLEQHLHLAKQGTVHDLHGRRHDHAAGTPTTVLPASIEGSSAVPGTPSPPVSPREALLLQEIAGLASIIEQAKADIASVSVEEIRVSHIPGATIELDAIVQHTAMATNGILECCEVLDQLGSSLDPVHAKVVQGVTTRIYEACSFQDITGQRITKVVKALQAIETKISVLSNSGKQPFPSVNQTALPSDPASLLNGPMLPQDAMAQEDIDKLLADFG